LQNLSGSIKDYDPMRPDTDLPAPVRQEFVDVHAAVLDLGRRLAQRVENEHAFAAHAAHALRTPLAGMDAQLAMAMKEVSGNARPRLERTREAVERLKRVITALLALFRSNAALQLQEIDLAELVAHLPVEGLTIHIGEDRAFTGDPNLMAAALANLLDNALRHGAHACWITVQPDPMGHRLTLRDDGPGVDVQRRRELQLGLDQAFDAGFVGLGLKLAALVAKAHNGRLVIDDPAPGTGGFSITMVLAPQRPAPR
jgi:signal transduction histidine kinase